MFVSSFTNTLGRHTLVWRSARCIMMNRSYSVNSFVRQGATSVVASVPTDVTTSESTIPSVFDNVVRLTFVDPSGARRKVSAYIGDTIWDVAQMHDIDLGPASVGAVVEARRNEHFVEPLYGEGPTSGFDMVVLSGNGASTVPDMTFQEQRSMSDYWDDDELYPESRLASVIPVTKEMDGMIVFVPDRVVDDIY